MFSGLDPDQLAELSYWIARARRLADGEQMRGSVTTDTVMLAKLAVYLADEICPPQEPPPKPRLALVTEHG